MRRGLDVVAELEMVGTRLGKYEIREEIGKGGMAVVYRGFDTELEREVAIKVLHPHLSAQPESKRRFHREARAVARLRAPNILEIYDYSGKESDQAFIVTEFIHGPTLRAYCEEHPEMPTEVAALVALEVCRGLRHAHENKIIHRDIKPENIMVRADGVVKITDFGIAQVAGTTQMTVTGQILGSPAHMSPEHVENKPLDFRADIFSLGTLLYWLTTARLPFEGRNPHAVIKRIVEGDYPDPVRVRPSIGERMARIVRRCLEVDPKDRYPAVDALMEDLAAFLSDLGVDPSAKELRAYFADPAGYAARHQAALLGRLIERGKEERRRRNVTAAIDYFNRALAIDEKNEEVLALVEQMSAGTRLRKVLEVSAVALALAVALAAVAWGVVRASSHEGRGRDAAATAPAVDAGARLVAESVDAGANGSADASEASSDGGTPKLVIPDIKRVVKRVVPATSVAPRLVRIVPSPPAARVLVDGHDYGEYGSVLARGIQLGEGSHSVRLEPRDPWYEPLEFTLRVPVGGADAGLLAVTRSLPFRPALVRINTTAPEATVFIPHRERARANRLFRVPMNAREERVQMIVSAEGFRSAVLEVVLRAGEEYSRDVALEPEPTAPGLATTTPP